MVRFMNDHHVEGEKFFKIFKNSDLNSSDLSKLNFAFAVNLLFALREHFFLLHKFLYFAMSVALGQQKS